jgi:lipoprotein NlpI
VRTRRCVLVVCLVWLGANVVHGDEPAARPADPFAALKQELAEREVTLSKELTAAPKRINLLSQRGDARFFLGKFADAVADYDAMVTLDEGLDTSHWRRGIALFYAGKYERAARQFEVYHSFDNVDRENGIWRYLSQHKAYGREKARAGLLKYEKDDREPFPDVYRLFAGEITGDALLTKIREAKIGDDERTKRLFYAELYVGLDDFVEGRVDSARKHLQAATDNTWGREVGGGPGWMWHVGRVHAERLAAEKR